MADKFLEVGLTEDERQIVINVPKFEVDAKGGGFIVFTSAQARNLASILLRKADEIDYGRPS